VNALCHRLRIRPRWEGFEGSGSIVDVNAVLLHALSCLKTLSLLTGDNPVSKLQQILEPKAVVPGSPYLVL
jgi:hypothetical protein